VNSQTSDETYNALNRFATNLNESARTGKLDPVIGRDEEIRRVATDSVQKNEKQSDSYRGAWCGQNRHSRRHSAPHCQRRCAREPQVEDDLLAFASPACTTSAGVPSEPPRAEGDVEQRVNDHGRRAVSAPSKRRDVVPAGERPAAPMRSTHVAHLQVRGPRSGASCLAGLRSSTHIPRCPLYDAGNSIHARRVE